MGGLETVYLDFIYQPVRDDSGQVAGIFVQGYDVTENVMAAKRQKLMIDELNHRVKNTLATVQSIAVQTARSHADPATFAEGFQARLMALSHTHDLLTHSHWEGALSAPAGRVLVDWAVADQGRRRLQLTWREIGGPAVLSPTRRGFGSRLIERNVRHDLAGEVKLDYASNGFSAEFSVPLDRGRS